jgi:hypothetical protein
MRMFKGEAVVRLQYRTISTYGRNGYKKFSIPEDGWATLCSACFIGKEEASDPCYVKATAGDDGKPKTKVPEPTGNLSPTIWSVKN